MLRAMMSSIFSTLAFSRGATEATPALLTSMVMVWSSRRMLSTLARPGLSLRSAASAAPGLAHQARGERLEPRLVAGHQDEVVATLREAVGIDGADARGGAGDEGSALRGGIAHDLLLRRR